MNTTKTVAQQRFYYVVMLLVAVLTGCKIGVGEPYAGAVPVPKLVFSGLDGKTIYSFHQTEQGLLAGTDQGLYLLDLSQHWQRVSDATWEIHHIVVPDPFHWVANVTEYGRDYVAQSVDQGASWQVLSQDWHSPAEVFFTTDQLLFDTQPVRFYLTDSHNIVVRGYDGYIRRTMMTTYWQQSAVEPTSANYLARLIDDMETLRALLVDGYQYLVERRDFTLWLSLDNGNSWKTYNLPDRDLWAHVWSITSRVEQQGVVVYLGLYKGGVLKVILPGQI